MRFFRDLSASSATAGVVAVLVAYSSSVAIVFQAAQAFGATPAQVASWMWALGLGMGLCTALPSLVLRQPVMADAERIARFLDNFAVSGNLSRVPYPYRLADARHL